MVYEIIYAGVFSACPPVVHHLINPSLIEEVTDEMMILLQALDSRK